ncbi:T9SS type B sorting domain-containing protein [Aureibaculum sp. A20]|uniref:T9SS type B sorting domain-containing protein n=1 Tax=Aureibaculum flavum TaxID=2795986 RepID=A0ABS0WLH5_9FLAO|nr:T9SS type B sorting domain-containing protein [Aureibaculum flavum]MBJ2172816.1 T9SS type B sorting domain-containing protein [Aureibaculum flavum]
MFKKSNYYFLFLFLISFLGSAQNAQINNAELNRQAYCPLSEIKIVPVYTIDNKKSVINTVNVKITSGYQKAHDMLKLTNALLHLSISTNWNVAEGKLILTSSKDKILTITEWISAVKDVAYINNSASVSGDRTFSVFINNNSKNTVNTYIFVPTISEVIANERCGSGSLKLSAKATGDVYWYDSPSLGIPIFKGENFITPMLTTTTTYYVVAGSEGCLDGKRIPITATVFNLPTAQKKTALINCDEDGKPDGLTFFNLKEATEYMTLGYVDDVDISYYISEADAITQRNAIINPDNFSNDKAITVYARIENKAHCYFIADLVLNVSTTAFPEGYQRELVGCDGDMVNDGITAFDLTMAGTDFMAQFPKEQNLEVSFFRSYNDALLENNKILNETNYFNKTPFKETLYVRVENKDNGACYGIGAHLVLTVMATPEFKVKPTAILCWEEGSTKLETFEADDNYRYEWTKDGVFIGNTRTLEVKDGGEYKVVGISTYGCRSIPRTIIVREVNTAVPYMDDISIKDGYSDNNTIILNDKNLGLGDYEYALDSLKGSYQPKPLFKNVTSGVHTIFIREKHNCGTSSIKIFVFEYPQSFTPNNDGINDFWNITEGLDDIAPYSVTILSIFNSSGQLVTTINPFDIGWDGTDNKDKAMPEGVYSFALNLIDKEGKKLERKGNFYLKRE